MPGPAQRARRSRVRPLTLSKHRTRAVLKAVELQLV